MSAEKHHYELGEEARFYERLIFNYRPYVMALFALVTVWLAYQASFLKPDASFEKMIPMQHPYIRAMMDNIDDIGAAGTSVQVVVEATQGDIFSAGYLETLRRISDEALYLPGVYQSRVQSLWTPNVRWMEVTEDGFDGGTVIPADYDGSAQSIEVVRQNILRSGLVGRLIADDFRSSIIEIPLIDSDPTTGERLDYPAFARLLENNLRERYQSDAITIRITGFAKLIGDLIDGIGVIVVFAVITLLVTLILLYHFCRCPIAAVAPLLCSIIAVVWQLGLLKTFGYGINAYSMLVPFLVFAIGVSHGVQIINTITIEMSEGASANLAARKAYRALYLPGMIALLSDGLGFITLFLIDIEVIQELAIAASLGVAVIIFTNLVLLPVLISCLGVCEQGIEHIRKRQQKTAHWRLLARAASPALAPKSLLLAVILLGAGLWGASHLQIGDLDRGAPELHPDSRYNTDVAYVNEHYAVSSDVFMVMVNTAPERCSQYSNMALVDRFAWTMSTTEGVQSAISYVDVSKQVLMGFNEGNPKYYTLPRDQRALDGTFFAIPQPLINRECSFAPVILFLSDHKADTLQRVVSRAEAFAREHNSDEIRFVLASGNAGIEAATNQVIEAAQSRMLWLVYGVVCVLVMVMFLSPAATACIVLPLVLTSVLCQALMAALGIGVKVATLPVIALGVGVGVDYGIYIYGRLERFLRQGMDLETAYFNTLRTTGKAVALTGVALAIGVATWAFSPVKFQADMGLLLVFMFLWNMVGALWLLPALAHYLINTEKLAARGPRWQDIKSENGGKAS